MCIFEKGQEVSGPWGERAVIVDLDRDTGDLVLDNGETVDYTECIPMRLLGVK